MTRLQVDMLFDAQGWPATAFLMRYESIQQDFNTVCDRLAKSRVPLPWINIGLRREYRSCFDEESQALFD